ncbi:hypothetical protein L6452_15792 [Arctium lappa]|uniref:Uncharacterized protein n=1 Tax=Arctium lappa TaxID=4217 RepID=A0ACB9CPM7_ARCLA|nr:hypothetical protein L6452_15792 [Arctium lappa]
MATCSSSHLIDRIFSHIVLSPPPSRALAGYSLTDRLCRRLPSSGHRSWPTAVPEIDHHILFLRVSQRRFAIFFHKHLHHCLH